MELMVAKVFDTVMMIPSSVSNIKLLQRFREFLALVDPSTSESGLDIECIMSVYQCFPAWQLFDCHCHCLCHCVLSMINKEIIIIIIIITLNPVRDDIICFIRQQLTEFIPRRLP